MFVVRYGNLFSPCPWQISAFTNLCIITMKLIKWNTYVHFTWYWLNIWLFILLFEELTNLLFSALELINCRLLFSIVVCYFHTSCQKRARTFGRWNGSVYVLKMIKMITTEDTNFGIRIFCLFHFSLSSQHTWRYRIFKAAWIRKQDLEWRHFHVYMDL